MEWIMRVLMPPSLCAIGFIGAIYTVCYDLTLNRPQSLGINACIGIAIFGYLLFLGIVAFIYREYM